MNKRVIISTPRLILHEFNADSGPELFELNNDPDVMQYTGDTPFQSIEEAQQFARTYNPYDDTDRGRWIMRIRETDEFVGWCGLNLNPDRETDLGFRLLKKFWGKGYAKEAASACIVFGFEVLHLPQLIARVQSQNTRSKHLIEKLGFTYYSDIICGGEDAHLYILKNNLNK